MAKRPPRLKSLAHIRAGKDFNWKDFGKLVDSNPYRAGWAAIFGGKPNSKSELQKKYGFNAYDKGYDYFHGNFGRWYNSKDRWNPNRWRRQREFFKAAWDLFQPEGGTQEANTRLKDTTFDPVDTSSDTPGVFEGASIDDVHAAFKTGDEAGKITQPEYKDIFRKTNDNTEAGSSLENPPIDNTIDLDTDGIDNIGAVEDSIRDNQDIFLPLDQQQSSTYGNTLGYDTRQNRSNLQYGR
tara:strand:- start:593 stop:1309 length:717 start_codon:yes stop_codon:yes gene_type:complete